MKEQHRDQPRGMADTMRRFADHVIAMCVDTKQSCVGHGWGVFTASFIVRDKLRNTTLARIHGKRVQGPALTSHACPVLQAVIQIENNENLTQFFETLQRLWAKVCPGRPPLVEVASQ